MADNNHLFIWSDGWYIEENKAWFIGGREGILFCLDLKSNVCEYVAEIPEKTGAFRVVPRCIKYESNIYCMPDRGNSIWIFDLVCRKFKEIKLSNLDDIRVEIAGMWRFGNHIFAVSYGMGQIIEIDLVKKEIVACYMLGGSEGLITYTIRDNNEIYSLYGSGKIYIFNMETKEIIRYELPDIGRKFYSLCLMEKKFCLTGYYKEIYFWDKEKNSIVIKDGFPRGFGKYDFTQNTEGKTDYEAEKYETPAFLYVVEAARKVWFIPYQTNKILFMEQDDEELHTFEIEEESETKQSILKNEYGAKYILEYVTEMRYIGLFSLKNKRILEIDAKQLTYEWKNYFFSCECLKQCAEKFGNVFRDRFSFERKLYWNEMKFGEYEGVYVDKSRAGVQIYQIIENDLSVKEE